jgi:hypothetical protein
MKVTAEAATHLPIPHLPILNYYDAHKDPIHWQCQNHPGPIIPVREAVLHRPSP